MLTYYDDKAVRITSTTARVDDRSIPVGGVFRIWQQRGARSWSVLAARGTVGVALIAVAVTAVLGLVVGLTVKASSTVTIILIGGSILIGLAIMPLADLLLGRLDDSYDRGAHVVELWAEVRGRPVLLVRSRDARRIGQIHRALRRAVEADTQHRRAAAVVARRTSGARVTRRADPRWRPGPDRTPTRPAGSSTTP